MDLPFKKIDKWTIETAQMKHSARKNSLNPVAQSRIRKLAAEYGVADYAKLVEDVTASPESYEDLSDQEREFCDVASSIGVWAVVTGCIKPYIQIDEWLSLSELTIEALSEATRELNSHWYVMPDFEKKTEEPQPTSTPDSTNS